MTVSSKFSLILLHDDGGTHRVRMNQGTLRLLIFLLVLSPLLGILGLWVGWEGWQTVGTWQAERRQYQTQIDTLRVELERRVALEALLTRDEGEDPAPGAGPMPALPPASAVAVVKPEVNPVIVPAQEAKEDAGEDAPPDKARAAVDLGIIRVENMQARMLDRRNLRASVDMYSADPDGKQLGGRTEFSLLTADGQQHSLSNDGAAFRISRFKKVVSTSPLPVAGTEVENAAVMVEVIVEDKLVYRNMFSIESR